MKTLKSILITLLILGSFSMANAQRTVVRVYPKHGTVVKTVNNPSVVVHNKTNFYFADGVWYRARGRNYVVAAAPVGIKVRRLPRTRSVVVVNGRRLYKYRGVWYKRTGRNYVVVNV
ncbi:hypothetical protein HME9304_00092 [Flagellimonas maritima]|uniref:Uncharacterized protein n=1 Tax=Flagellimonas maritima TaxID=1383885 RepID=A0A2Z4LMR7_9FLAO|nr:DUF6515 family protein [Allomuricauda aurantiaca]AWX43105.1 hypothetical protein HME9304_00092 [Allomuricauda aurantiaca]